MVTTPTLPPQLRTSHHNATISSEFNSHVCPNVHPKTKSVYYYNTNLIDVPTLVSEETQRLLIKMNENGPPSKTADCKVDTSDSQKEVNAIQVMYLLFMVCVSTRNIWWFILYRLLFVYRARPTCVYSMCLLSLCNYNYVCFAYCLYLLGLLYLIGTFREYFGHYHPNPIAKAMCYVHQ